MIGQAELDAIGARANATLVVARKVVGREGTDAADAHVAVLLAIVEQLALANALAMIRLAREAGET